MAGACHRDDADRRPCARSNIGATVHYQPLHTDAALSRRAARTGRCRSRSTIARAASYAADQREHDVRTTPRRDARLRSLTGLPVTQYGFQGRLTRGVSVADHRRRDRGLQPRLHPLPASGVQEIRAVRRALPRRRRCTRKMVDEVAQHGQGCTQYIRYTSNGEPLVHPKIYDMLDYAVRRLGRIRHAHHQRHDHEREAHRASCSRPGLHMVDVSIDALTPETYAGDPGQRRAAR